LEDLSPTEYSGLHIYTSADPDLMREGVRVINKLLPAIERRFPPVKPRACAGQNDRMLGAIVALDPETGEIIAMAGGAGGKDGVKYAGLALNAMDAPASVIKPFWQVKALAEGKLVNGERYTAASMIDPSNASVNGWRPSSGLRGVGRPRTKLAISADDFATYNLMLIGFENGKRFYETVTGNNITEPTGELAIGFGARTEVSPLGLARAYTIFGNNGFLIQPNPIDQVYLNGRELELKRKPANQVIDPGTAYITTQMMRSVLGSACGRTLPLGVGTGAVPTRTTGARSMLGPASATAATTSAPRPPTPGPHRPFPARAIRPERRSNAPARAGRGLV